MDVGANGDVYRLERDDFRYGWRGRRQDCRRRDGAGERRKDEQGGKDDFHFAPYIG